LTHEILPRQCQDESASKLSTYTSEVIQFKSLSTVQTHRHTHTGPIALRGPLKWSAKKLH